MLVRGWGYPRRWTVGIMWNSDVPNRRSSFERIYWRRARQSGISRDHRDFKTTLIHAGYAPGAHEVALAGGAFSTNPSNGLSACGVNSDHLESDRSLEIA